MKLTGRHMQIIADGLPEVIIITRNYATENVLVWGEDSHHMHQAKSIGKFFKTRLQVWTNRRTANRCIRCINSLDTDWTFCPYCGAGQNK